MIKTFGGSNASKQVVQFLQQTYGSEFSDIQAVRKQWYSYVAYTEAGAVTYTFFGNAVGTGGTNVQLTNIPKSGSFGNVFFLLKAIRCKFYIEVWDLQAWGATDATTLYSDLINGFIQAGVFRLRINSRDFILEPKPFLRMPPAHSCADVHTAGLDTLTLNEAAPNTLATTRSNAPYGSLNDSPASLYRVDPNIFFLEEQNFQVTVEYPSGAVGVIGTDITHDTTAPLYIGVSLDGVVFRPVQ